MGRFFSVLPPCLGVSVVNLFVGLILCVCGFGSAEEPGQHVFYLGDERLVVLRFQVLIDGKPYTVVWQEFLQRRFKELDADGDGVLNADEQRGMPGMEATLALGLGSGPRGNFNADLHPQDGKITQEEFIAYFRGAGLEPFRLRSEQADPNQLRSSPVVGRQPPADQAAKVLFEKLGADSDGRLTPEDFRSAVHALRKMDLDRDESISVGELVQTSNIFPVAIAAGTGGVPPRPKFLSPGGNLSNRQLAQQIVSALDGRRGEAKNNRLSSAELGLPAEILSPFDANGDGLIDLDETEQLIGAPPADMDLIVRLGKRDGGPPLEFTGTSSGRVSQGAASLTLGKVQMEIAVGEAGYSDRRVGSAAMEEPLVRAFTSMDQDNNGYLDAMESLRLGLNTTLFGLIDADKDGKVFQREYLAFYVPLAQMEQARVQLDVADRGRDLFSVLDSNSDGRLGSREFQAAVERLAGWDASGDGALSFDEIPQQFRLIVGRSTLNPSGRAVLASTAVRTLPTVRPRPTTGPQWFVRMDRNGDGDISPREFLGPPELFAKLDADGNGLLDVGEASAAVAPKQ